MVVRLDNTVAPSDRISSIGIIPTIPGDYNWSNNNGSITPYGYGWYPKTTGSSEQVIGIHYWNMSTTTLT